MGTPKSILLALFTETGVRTGQIPALQAHHPTLLFKQVLLNFSSFFWLRYLIHAPLKIYLLGWGEHRA